MTGSSSRHRCRGGVVRALSGLCLLAAVLVPTLTARAAPGEATPGEATPAPPPVQLVSSASCGASQVCHRLEVTCAGLAARSAELREMEVEQSKGTVVVATGVFGNRPYDQYPERQKTLDALQTAGFEVFALRWSDGKKGWGSTAEGAGYAAPMCGFTEVVRWLAAQRADRPEVLCAQGNSGAALQIAYGLAVYGLGDILDVAVLSGGPPLVRVDSYCFRPTRQKQAQRWRANGRRITDYLMGWEGSGDHCKNAQGTDDTTRALQATGLLPVNVPGSAPETRPRRFDYPSTELVFVQSEGDKSTSQARLFFDAVTSKTSWHSLPGRAHGVDREAPGAATVRQLLIDRCSAVAPSSP